MARGYSQSRSEGFAKKGSPADLRNQALDAQASQSAQKLLEASKFAVEGLLSRMNVPKLNADEMEDLVKYTASASERASDHLASHRESVEAAKRVLKDNKKGTYPYDDFDELTRGMGINLLFADEREEADEDEDIAGDYAEKMSQVLDYEYAEEVMSDTRGNYRRTNYDDYDRNEVNEEKNRADFAKSFIKKRLELADKMGEEIYANLDRVRSNAVDRWLNQREKGNV
jgi:hypothetical protein